MFTGLIVAVGKVAGVWETAGGKGLSIDAAGLDLRDVRVGDSIAVDGTCLTVIALTPSSFNVEVSPETLRCTAGFGAGRAVNLEKALRLSDRLGGHVVTGHVDGVGEVTGAEDAGDHRRLAITVAGELARYIARKGSVAVNGVSLTVNDVEGNGFSVNLIPHTLHATNLKYVKPGDRVNIETDLLARYAERLRQADHGS